ncbi:MAG: germination protein YpeB [Bacillota bacterium]
MRRSWIFGTLSILLAAACIWGFTQYRARRNWEIQAENQYQRAFQDLSFHVDSIESLTAKALVITSPRLMVKTFSDVWRESFACQQSLGQLPLTNMDLERTDKFISQMTAFTYRVVQKRVDGQMLSEKDWQGLSDLWKRCKFLSGRLHEMQAELLNSQHRWLDVGQLSTAAANLKDRDPYRQNPMTKNFMMMEDGMKRFPSPTLEGAELNYGEKPAGLRGRDITLTECARITRNFIGLNRLKNMEINITPRLKLPIPIYTVAITPKKGRTGETIYMDVSRKGGHVLWMLCSRLPGKSRITKDTAVRVARRLLARIGFSGMKLLDTEKNNNIYTCIFARQEKNVVIHPESIKLQIGADNSEFLGYEAENYFTFSQTRRVLTPILKPADARRKCSPHLNILSSNLAIILGDDFKQKLCYEIKGDLNKDKFLLYINALTGREEKVSRVKDKGIMEEL